MATDPLSLLREYFIKKQDIIVFKDYICFGQVAYTKDTPTNFISKKVQGSNDYYQLQTLLFFCQNIDLKQHEYIQRAFAMGVPTISLPDRKELIKVFSDLSAVSQSIDKFANFQKSYLTKDVVPSSHQQTFKKANENAMETENNFIIYRDDVAAAQDVRTAGPGEDVHLQDRIEQDSNWISPFIFTINEIVKDNSLLIINQNTKDRLECLSKDMLEYLTLMKDPNNESSFKRNYDMTFDKYYNSDKKHFRANTRIICGTEKKLGDILGYLHQVSNSEKNKKDKKTDEQTQTGPYNRYGQEMFKEKDNTAGFEINVLGSFQGLVNSNSANTTDRNAPVLKKRTSKIPIIIVPATGNTMLNITNIREFLEEFNYISISEAEKLIDNNTNFKSNSDILIHRKKVQINNGRSETSYIPYRIVNCISRIKQEDWSRVVAVFIHGPTWQFKNWPWPIADKSFEIFQNVKPFYVTLQNDKIDPNIEKWNAEILTINRSKRHLDKPCVLKFWESLDAFMRSKKSHLKF